MKYRWEEGWSFSIRLQLIVVMLGVSTFLLVAGFINQGVYKDAGATVTFLFLGTVNTLLQVFLIGSYDRFELTRNSKGKTTLTRTRRIAFFELPPTKMDWKESVGLVVVGSHAAGLFEWLFCAYLATLGLVPGIIFYVLELRPDRFELNLCDVYGASEGLLFRTKDRDQAVEVMKVVVDATGLSCRNLL